MGLKSFVLSLFSRNQKESFKKVLTQSKILFLYKYLKAHKWKVWALYHGVNNYLEAENAKFNLRRDIHRIEKGLSYKKVKNVFAESYILGVVSSLKLTLKNNTIDEDSLLWVVSVLEKYFSTVEHTNKIEIAFKEYNALNLGGYNKGFIPYNADLRPEINVSYDDLYTLALRRRSVRFYSEKAVEREKIMKAVELAKLAPSACNRLAYRYLYIDEAAVANQVSQIPGGVSGYKLNQLFVVIGEFAGYFSPRDSGAPIIDSSLATMSLLFALETLGLSTVCINWPNEPDKGEKIREILNLKKSEFVVMLLGVGYADDQGKVPYSKKISGEDILLINERIK